MVSTEAEMGSNDCRAGRVGGSSNRSALAMCWIKTAYSVSRHPSLRERQNLSATMHVRGPGPGARVL